jgi:NAD dependent epimerase/dehydratase family enzyme
MSWIMLADWVRIACYLLDKPVLSGPVNLTAPHPCTNAEFTAALAAAAGPRARLALPAVALRVGLGEVSSELLSSARVIPRRLLDTGEPGLWAAGTEIGPALAAELR